MFDDIATVAGKYRELPRLGNHSGTGRVDAVLKLIMHPASLLGMVGTAGAMAPAATMLGALPVTAGFRAGRSLAWYLSKPQTAGQAGKLLKSYFAVEHAFGSGVSVIAQREQALAQTIRNFALATAQETGDNADDVERALKEKIEAIRRGQ